MKIKYNLPTYEECLENIRDYSVEKKRMLGKINNVIVNYNIIV